MKTRKNALEWTVFSVSVAVIVTTMALLLSGGTSALGKRPDLRITFGTPSRTSAGFSVPVAVRNEGGETAESVRIAVSLHSQRKELERTELMIAFVPRQSQREGWVVFRHDPRCCQIRAQAMAYEKP